MKNSSNKSILEQEHLKSKAEVQKVLFPLYERVFFDENLEDKDIFSDNFINVFSYNFLTPNCQNNFESAFNLINKFSNDDKYFKLDLISNVDAKNCNMFHYLHKVPEVKELNFFLQKCETCFDLNSIREALSGKDKEKQTPLMKITKMSKNIDVLVSFYDFLRKMFSEDSNLKEHLQEVDENLYTTLQHSALNENIEHFKFISKIYRDNFSSEEIQKILLNEFNGAERNSHSLKEVFEKYFIGKNKQVAVDFIEKAFGSDHKNLRDYLFMNEEVEFLYQENFEKNEPYWSSLFEKFFLDKQIDHTEFYIKYYRKILRYISILPNQKRNIALFFENIEIILKNDSNLLFGTFFNSEDTKHGNLFHHVTKISDIEAWEIIFNKFKELLNEKLIASAMKQKNFNENTPLDLIAKLNQDVSSCEAFYKFSQNIFDSKSELDEYLLIRNEHLFTALHNSAFNENIEIFKYFTKIYQENFSASELQDIFLNKNTDMKNSRKIFLLEIVNKCNLENCEIVMKYLKELFSNQDENLKSFLLMKDRFDKTIFNQVIWKKDKQKLKIVTECFESVLDKDLKDLLV
jgi:hypothetical protein